MGKRITLEDIDEMLEYWKATIDAYNEAQDEGMEHERGYDFSQEMFGQLIDARRAVKRLVAVVQKVKAEKIAYKVGAPEFHELRFEANAAIAELEQP